MFTVLIFYFSIIIWVKTLPYFTQMMIFFNPIPLFERKKVSFDDFFMTTWERENESERKKEPQIPRLSQWFLSVLSNPL